MAKRLATAVALTSPNGGTVTYRAGSTPPPEVAAKITNPDAWLPEDFEPAPGAPAPEPVVAPVLMRPEPPAQPSAELGAVDPEGAPPPTGDSGGDSGGGEEPARNASTETWRTYAEGLGQTVAADAGRDAIIAQLTAAGLIKE